jgi:hypothetical protein
MDEDDALPLDEIEVGEYGPHDRFNIQIWIPEGAEWALGEERFEGLVDRLRQLEGVSDLVQEDREVYLARGARGIDLAALRARVVDIVRAERTAAIAEGIGLEDDR